MSQGGDEGYGGGRGQNESMNGSEVMSVAEETTGGLKFPPIYSHICDPITTLTYGSFSQ